MSQEKQEQENLLDFNWDNSEENFFGFTTSGNKVEDETPKEEIKEEEKEEKEEPKKNKKPKEEVEEVLKDEDFSFGAPTETKEETKEDKSEETSKVNSDSIYNDLVHDLKESSILRHIELEEGEELDSERFQELIQEEYETEVSSRIERWAKEDLDEDAQAFIKFKKDGGSTADFFATYSKESSIPKGDIEDESYQDKLIRHQLRDEGWDSEEIEDRLQYLTDSGRKRKFAEKYDEKIKEDLEAERLQVIKQQEDNARIVKQKKKEHIDNIKNAISETTEIAGAKINEAEKTKLFNFLTKETHKVNDNLSITGFQQKLGEVFKDTNKTLLLAKLLESDFDMSAVKKKAVTENTKKVKSKLEQRSSLRPSGSGSSSHAGSLADLFD